MSISTTELPEAYVNGERSRWSAVHQPIVFKVQRFDTVVQMKYEPTGSNVILKVQGLIPSQVAVGQKIKYKSPAGVNYIYYIQSINGSNITTTADEGFVGAEYGGQLNYVDAFDDYYIKTTVRQIDFSNTAVELGTINSKVDVNGQVNINVSEWLKAIMEPDLEGQFKNEFEYNTINKAMPGEGGVFRVIFEEFRDGVQISTFRSAKFYWTNSNKQPGEEFSGNMAEFVPTLDDTRVDRAKFISMFDKPTYFPGFPFSLNWIYSDNLLNKQVTREERTYNINGNLIDSTSDDVSMAERVHMNRLMLKQGYASQIKTLEVWLETGDATTDSPVEEPVAIPGEAYSDGTIFQPYLEELPAEKERSKWV